MDYSFKSVTEILLEKLKGWYEALVAFLPNFVLAILVLLFFVFISRYVERVVRKLVGRVSSNVSLVSLTGVIVSRLVILMGLFYALGLMHLDQTVSSLLAGAGIVGLALGFAFQDLTANFLSGIFITISQPIRVGDVIETNGFMGKVLEIRIRSTILDNFAGQEIELPSRLIFEKPIINYGKTGSRRLQVNCGVSYDDDLEKVQKIAVEAVEALGIHDPNKPVVLHYREFGDSSINFLIWFWLDLTDPNNVGPLLGPSMVIMALKKAFDENSITIPFPIRALDFQQQGATPVQVQQQNGHSNGQGSSSAAGSSSAS